MKEEQEFYQSFGPKLPGHVQRIETSTGSGVPDLVWCYGGVTKWIETKIDLPGRGTLLRKEQYAWGMRHASQGGKVLIISWCVDIQSAFIWRFPDVKIEVKGKYLHIVNLPLVNVEKSDIVEALIRLCC